MKFSIIVVCLNAGNDLALTVKSILGQTFDNFEIIVKDGLSTDNSLEILPLSNKIRVYSEKDTGIYDAMNQAITYATGDFVLFLNCGDTFYDVDVLMNTTKHIDENNIPIIYYGDCYTVNRKAVLRYPNKFNDYVCFSKTLCHQATVYPKAIFDQLQFDCKYKVVADFNFYLTAYKKRLAVLKHIPVIFVAYQGGGFSEDLKNKQISIKESNSILKESYGKYKYIYFSLITGKTIKRFLNSNKITVGLYNKLAIIAYSIKNKIFK